MAEKIVHRVVEELSTMESYQAVYRSAKQGVSMPSIDALEEIMTYLKRILFPGYFAHSEVTPDTIRYYIGANVDKVVRLLNEQIHRGFCFPCQDDTDTVCGGCLKDSQTLTLELISRLPEIRRLLATDALAAYQGDPAAKAVGETIFCYPSLRALTHHRIAHELYRMGVPLIPRIISEMAHAQTGIDIHPGADIGDHFFIDHGTGVVVGETCVIGHHVRLYQGVTLGAKSFPLDKDGKPVKGIARHPIIGDNVTIYAGATVLGRVTVGSGSVIGGNLWVTRDVAPNSRISQGEFRTAKLQDGAGI
ncbi:MAG: serine acetyltransferase [Acidobacteria bacterium]|nr:serine acetyltransferase [Acidobacteriota bacterium]